MKQSLITGLSAQAVWKTHNNSVDNVCGFTARRPELRNCSIHVPPGETLVVLGADGAGKTTLLDVLSGQRDITAGSVMLNRHPVQLARQQVKELVGICPGTDPVAHGALSPYALFHLVADFRGLLPNRDRELHIAFLLQQIGVFPSRHESMNSLSEGLRRKVIAALAFVGYPPYLILDEPSVVLDPVGRRQLWAVVHSAPRECGIVFSTQHYDDAEFLSSRVLLLDGGGMRALGTAEELKLRAAGLMLEVRRNASPPHAVEEWDSVHEWIVTKFIGVRILDHRRGFWRYHIAVLDTLREPTSPPPVVVVPSIAPDLESGGSSLQTPPRPPPAQAEIAAASPRYEALALMRHVYDLVDETRTAKRAIFDFSLEPMPLEQVFQNLCGRPTNYAVEPCIVAINLFE